MPKLTQTAHVTGNAKKTTWMKPPFEIRLHKIDEVRHGSPYMYCQIEFVGTDITLANCLWQNKYAWSDDFSNLVLIKWNFDENEPGFHFYIIDLLSKKIFESERILGLPDSIAVSSKLIKYSKFLYDKRKSGTGDLCCHLSGEYVIPEIGQFKHSR